MSCESKIFLQLSTYYNFAAAALHMDNESSEVYTSVWARTMSAHVWGWWSEQPSRCRHSGARGTELESADFGDEAIVTSVPSMSSKSNTKRNKRPGRMLAATYEETFNEAENGKQRKIDHKINANNPMIAKTQGPKKIGVRMAVIAEDDKKITSEMVNPIRTAIWEMLENTPDPLPVVNAGTLQAGALHFSCEGTMSAQWLHGLNGKIIEGIKLKVVSAKQLRQPVKMAWKTRNTWCLDVSKLMIIMQRFNPSLNTKYWKVVNTLIEDNHVRRIVFMDKASADYIKARGYCLQSGMDRSIFKLLEQPGKKVVDTELGTESSNSHTNDNMPDTIDIWAF